METLLTTNKQLKVSGTTTLYPDSGGRATPGRPFDAAIGSCISQEAGREDGPTDMAGLHRRIVTGTWNDDPASTRMTASVTFALAGPVIVAAARSALALTGILIIAATLLAWVWIDAPLVNAGPGPAVPFTTPGILAGAWVVVIVLTAAIMAATVTDPRIIRTILPAVIPEATGRRLAGPLVIATGGAIDIIGYTFANLIRVMAAAVALAKKLTAVITSAKLCRI